MDIKTKKLIVCELFCPNDLRNLNHNSQVILKSGLVIFETDLSNPKCLDLQVPEPNDQLVTGAYYPACTDH